MRKIAHRGNTNGPSIHENQLWYIDKALDAGYDAEIDIWIINGQIWSGHDSAQYLVPEEFLYKNILHLWIHCKNFEALAFFASMGNSFNYFWHQDDDYTITSHNFIWTYPQKEIGPWSIIVDLECLKNYKNIPYGICTDYTILI